MQTQTTTGRGEVKSILWERKQQQRQHSPAAPRAAETKWSRSMRW
jgi:hypothetical protein